MLLSKKNFILATVLISCLIIFLFSPDSTSNYQTNPKQKNTNLENITKNQNLDLFKNIWNIKSKKINQILKNSNYPIVKNNIKENTNVKNTTKNILPALKSIEVQNKENPLSLENILAEVENLEVENLPIQSHSEKCFVCSKKNKRGEDSLNEYAAVIGFSSWEEYSLSEQYQLAKDYFLANQDPLLKQETPPSACPFVLASLGGPICSCEDRSCFTETAYGRYYHCLGPCCCVCCWICCGR
jgi:hypothetical protein